MQKKLSIIDILFLKKYYLFYVLIINFILITEKMLVCCLLVHVELEFLEPYAVPCLV